MSFKLPDASSMIGQAEPGRIPFGPGYRLPNFVAGAGEGLKEAGRALQGFAAEQKAKQNALQAAQAEADFSIANDQLYFDRSKDENYQDAPNIFRQQSQEGLNAAASRISDPTRRAEFLARHSVGVERKALSLENHAYTRGMQDTVAQDQLRLDSITSQASEQANNDAYVSGKLQDARRIIDSHYWLTPHQRQVEWNQFRRGFVKTLKGNQDPDKILQDTDKFITPKSDNAPAQKIGPQSSIAPLQPSPGRTPDLARVDSRLKQAVAEGATTLPDGYKVTINEGYNAQGHARGSQHHIPGSGALDVQIWTPDGKKIPNEGNDTTGMYTLLAKGAYQAAQKLGVGDRFAWGGRFGTVTGGEVPDLMHFDLGGDRGHLKPALAQMFGGGTQVASNVGGGSGGGVNNRVAYAMDYLQKNGFSKAQAAGFVGNLIQENSQLNPNAVHDNGRGLGIAGWNGDRLAALRSAGGVGSFEKQLAFAVDELNGPESAALDAIKRATTPQEAAVAAQKYFRPGDPRTPNRIKYAEQVYGQGGDNLSGTQYAQADTGVMSDASSNAYEVASDGTHVPMASRKGTPYEYLTANDILEMRAAAIKEKRARARDADLELSRQEKERKRVSDQNEMKVIDDALQNNSDISAHEIMQMGLDGRLTREAAERIPGVIQKLLQDKKLPPAVSHHNMEGLLDGIRKPPGDPDKITSLNPIYDALIHDQINTEDFKFLRDEYVSARTDAGQKFQENMRDFLKAIQPKIDKSNPLMGSMDPGGRESFWRYQFDVKQKAEEYRKNNKDPMDLLNPSKPDYVGSDKFLEPYQKTLKQSLEDQMQMLKRGTAPADNAPSANAPGWWQSHAPTWLGGTSAPKLEPRKPGESLDDYDKRTGG